MDVMLSAFVEFGLHISPFPEETLPIYQYPFPAALLSLQIGSLNEID